jgi:hypothetical protein
MKWWWCPLSTRPPRREATHILILVCGFTWLVFEPTIYHTGCEYANHIRPMLEPTIYHTGCEHANHTRPMLEPTIYHTGYQHANHTRKVFEPTIYHSGCNHANHTRPMLDLTIYHIGCEHTNHPRPMLEPTIHHTRGEHANNTRHVRTHDLPHWGVRFDSYPLIMSLSFNTECGLRQKPEDIFTGRYSVLCVLDKSLNMSSPYVTLYPVS